MATDHIRTFHGRRQRWLPRQLTKQRSKDVQAAVRVRQAPSKAGLAAPTKPRGRPKESNSIRSEAVRRVTREGPSCTNVSARGFMSLGLPLTWSGNAQQKETEE